MTTLLALSGSPSPDSRSALLTEHLVQRLSREGYQVGHVRVRELPASDLLAGRSGRPALRQALQDLDAAHGVVVATPVYQAAYSGLLKSFLDLLPRTGLAGKTVLPLMTGGTLAHALALDYALRPVLSALRAGHIVSGTFVLDEAVESCGSGTLRLRADAELRVEQAVGEFLAALPGEAGAGPLPDLGRQEPVPTAVREAGSG